VIHKYKHLDKLKTEKLVEAFKNEKEKLVQEIASLKEKLKTGEKDKQQKTDLSSFMKSMQAPKGPIFSQEASMDAKMINSRSHLSEKESVQKASPNTTLPIQHEILETNYVNHEQVVHRSFNPEEHGGQNKITSGDARKMFVQPSDLKKWPSNSNLDLDSISNVQESDHLSASISFNQIDTSRVLSEAPEQSSSRNPHAKRADPIQEFMRRNLAKLNGFVKPEESKLLQDKHFEQNLNIKTANDLRKNSKGFSFNNTDEYQDDTKQNLMKKPMRYQQDEPIMFTSVNGGMTESIDNGSYRLSLDPSEIMKERTGEMKNIRDITHDFDDIDNNSMVASERGFGG